MRRGDLVQLSSGGTKMTIFNFVKDLPEEAKVKYINTGATEEDVVCKWFVGTTLKKEVFKKEMLRSVDIATRLQGRMVI
ncbi:DUF2158 domain-containing protein [Pleionea litopenaei]|uniref:DUF2158 domain-containing protein n=1 Tax=Pleionea litopenaei TaxID=3070815 RepID=A0AA51X6Z6_9GAMM|nr:DUF2158 domain-containing protein [Pleionea sp. HL-JVS1]WMS87384.1 DUF2158 domain-containing protein [Pleionea sp. HL-JVS1]